MPAVPLVLVLWLWSKMTESLVSIAYESYPLLAPNVCRGSSTEKFLFSYLSISLFIIECRLCAKHCALNFVIAAFAAALQVVRLEGALISMGTGLYRY